MNISYSLTALANAISAILIAAGTNVTKWAGTTVATPNTAGVPLVDTHYHRGSVENVLQSGRRDVYVGASAVGAVGVIRSVNYYTGTISQTAGVTSDKDVTITSVTTSKAFIIPAASPAGAGLDFGVPDSSNIFWERVSIQAATNVRFHSVVNGSGGNLNLIYAFWVVEFY